MDKIPDSSFNSTLDWFILKKGTLINNNYLIKTYITNVDLRILKEIKLSKIVVMLVINLDQTLRERLYMLDALLLISKCIL